MVRYLILWTEFDGDSSSFSEQQHPILFENIDQMFTWCFENLTEEDHDWMFFKVDSNGTITLATDIEFEPSRESKEDDSLPY